MEEGLKGEVGDKRERDWNFKGDLKRRLNMSARFVFVNYAPTTTVPSLLFPLVMTNHVTILCRTFHPSNTFSCETWLHVVNHASLDM